MSKHTPEPWQIIDEKDLPEAGWNAGGWFIESGGGPEASHRVICGRAEWPNRIEESQANAERIVACVNACAGIANPEDYLKREASDRKELVRIAEKRGAEIRALRAQRDELLAALEAMDEAREAEARHSEECPYESCGFRGCPHDEVWEALTAADWKVKQALARVAKAKGESHD